MHALLGAVERPKDDRSAYPLSQPAPTRYVKVLRQICKRLYTCLSNVKHKEVKNGLRNNGLEAVHGGSELVNGLGAVKKGVPLSLFFRRSTMASSCPIVTNLPMKPPSSCGVLLGYPRGRNRLEHRRRSRERKLRGVEGR